MKQRIKNKRLVRILRVLTLAFLCSSKVSNKKKMQSYIELNKYYMKSNKYTFSYDSLLYITHDSNKYCYKYITNEKQFLQMLKFMHDKFKACIHKYPKNHVRFSYFRKLLNRTPNIMKFVFAMSYLVSKGKVQITSHGLNFVHNKDRKGKVKDNSQKPIKHASVKKFSGKTETEED